MLRPFLILPLLAVPAFAQTLDDRHLPVVPRTAEEAAKVAAILAPPTDFTKLEKFEDKPAGAATVRARDNADAFVRLLEQGFPVCAERTPERTVLRSCP